VTKFRILEESGDKVSRLRNRLYSRRGTKSFVALALALSVCNSICAFADTTTTSADGVKASEVSPQAKALLKNLSELVKEYFPKAKITSTPTSLHFEYKVHERLHPYNRRNVLSPDLDGILGDVDFKPSEPREKIVGLIERPESIHSVLLMTPYSAPDKSWLSARLLFQPITPLDFMDTFKKLVSAYETPGAMDSPQAEGAMKMDATTDDSLKKLNSNGIPSMVADSKNDGPASTAQSNTSEQTSTREQSLTTENASIKDAGVDKIATTAPIAAVPITPNQSETAANSTMDSFSYPEGRFKVMLPGNPQVKYTDQAGMRMVDYLYTVPDGTFNVSYVILQEPPPNLKTSQLLDNMSQSVVNSLKGLHAKQSPASLQGYPGCQVDMPELTSKPGHSAQFKIFIVRNFIYIVGIAGKKDFLASQNAKKFLDTFQIIPKLKRN
jgi:hypothetical protein